MEETKERQTHRPRWPWLLLEGLLLLAAVPVGAFLLLYREVRPLTVWELTGSCPPASALLKTGGEGRWCFDTERIDWTKPGDVWVLAAGSGGPRIAMVRIEDTTPPTARGLSLVLGVDEEPGPDAFIADLSDRQLVGVSFERSPNFHTAGEYDVAVRLEDLSGNASLVSASCTILGAVPRLDMEAGEDAPPLADFLPNDTVEGRFVTDMDALDTSVPGVRTIEVEARGEVFETALVIHDTVPPVCAFETVAYTRTGQALAPESLVISASDATALVYSFDPEPDWTARGYQDVTVTVTDAGGNRIQGTVTVLISELQPLVWEASRRTVSATAVTERQQALDPDFTGEICLARFVPRNLGCFDINATVDGVPCIQRLFVVDTVAPALAFPKKLRAYLDHPQPPEALLQQAEDATALTFTYLVEPDWTKEGDQPVALAAVDRAGNRTELSGTVTVVQDKEAPMILGVVDQYMYVGEPVAYFAQASALDNADGEVELTVDNSAVDINTPGRYLVTYRATDRAGNTAQKTVRLTFLQPKVSEEELQKKADEVLSKLVTDDMTQGRKAYAIFRYIKANYVNTERSNKRDWRYEAWRGLTTQHGDCFTYCAAARVLLERIGAKVMFITRKSSARHYWLLVDLGTGWYHFDPYNDGPSRGYECFMLTTQQVRNLYAFFWQYDHKVYPETATTPFERDW